MNPKDPQSGTMDVRIYWRHEKPHRHRSRLYRRKSRFENTRADSGGRFVSIEYHDWPPGTTAKDNAKLVTINRVEVVLDNTPPDPRVTTGIEALLTRWLVRAYRKRYMTPVEGEEQS